MPRAGGCDKYGGTKLHDTTYADSRAGAVSCNMTAIPPARLRRATSLWSQREAQSIDKVSEERGSNQK